MSKEDKFVWGLTIVAILVFIGMFLTLFFGTPDATACCK